MRSTIVSRSAAAAKAQTASGLSKTKLANGLNVVAQENNGAVSQLILAFRAGSRYQSAAQHGLVHHIRNFVGRDAQSYPGLQLVWSAAASGANMSSFATRDLFGVQISVARDQAAYALSILGHVAAKPAFKPWELEDVTPTLLADLAHKNAYNVVFEDAHRAAFRNDSLSHSLYASKREIGAYKTEELTKFADKHFVSGNGVLVGVNVEAEVLKNYAEESGAIADGIIATNHGSPFRGGDFRRFARGNSCHIMVAGSGAPIGDVKARATQAVFLQTVGRTSPLKFATLPGSGLAALPTGVAGSGFEASYDGSGLVGVYLVANGANADGAVRAAVEALRAPKAQNVEDSKRRAITEIQFATESATSTAFDLANNALYKGAEKAEVLEAIGKVTAADVEKFAKTAFQRLAIAAYGNHGRVPYSDEL